VLIYGGVGTEYCGDGICQADEDAESCPGDCATSANINFRTIDLSYVSGSAVGYATSCGSSLTGYGHTTGSCLSYEHYCDDTDQDLNVPKAGGGTTLFWYVDADTVCVCEPDNLGTHLPARKYTTADSDASKVEITPTVIDSDKEVICVP